MCAFKFLALLNQDMNCENHDFVETRRQSLQVGKAAQRAASLIASLQGFGKITNL